MIRNHIALTGASFASMFFLGIGVAIVGAAARNIGIAPERVGLLITAQNAGFVVAVAIAGRLADTARKTVILAVGSGILALAFGAFYAVPRYVVNVAIMVVMGLGMGCYEGVTDPLLMDLHDRRESLYITINHSFVSLGSLAVTTYLIFLQMRFRVALVQTTVVVAVLGFLFLFARAPRREVTRGDRVGVVRLLFHQRPLALLFLGGLAAIGLGAGSIGLLTSFLMELRRFDQVTSKIGLAVFLSGLAVGRVVVGFMSKNEKSYDIATGFFALAGTLLGLLYFTPVFGVLTYVLVAAAGLSVAPILPFVIATAGLLYRHIPGTAMGLVKIAMPIGGIVVPALLSAVAAGFGFQASLAVFPVLGLGTSLVFLLSRGRVLASRADRS